MNKFKEIYNGWKNYIFQKSNVEVIAKYRQSICSDCEHLKLGVCVKCGCPNVGKVRSLSSFCPIGKWSAVEDNNVATVEISNDYPSVPMDNFRSSNEYIDYINNKPN